MTTPTRPTSTTLVGSWCSRSFLPLRRSSLIPVLLLAMVLASCSSGLAGAGETFLVVADRAEEKLYVYSVPDHDPVGEFDGMAVNDHTGFLSLPDGRVLFVDDKNEELVIMEVAEDGVEILERVSAGPGVHLAVSADLRCAAVSSGEWNDEAGMLVDPALTLVDLESYEAVQFSIATGEPGVMLTADALLHRNDDPPQIEVFPLDRVLADDFAFAEVLPIGEAGHGEAVSSELGRIYVATDEGIEAIAVDGTTLTPEEIAPWESDGLSGGRAFYVRMSTDGTTLVTYIANRAPDQSWGEWDNDAYILDLETNEPLRIPLANGYVWRMGIGDGYAVYFNLTPEGDPDGDHAHLLDLDTESETYGSIVASIPLKELSQRADPNPAIWMQPDVEYRRVTMTPDGRYAYISNGGDGTISVIDTDERDIVATIEVPTDLRGGGSLTTVQIGASMVDTIAR